MLCDEIGHLKPFCTTNKSNKVEGTVTNLKKIRYFERLTKYERFKYLLKQLDGSSLVEIGWQVVPQTLTSDPKELFVFVWVCARTCACVCVGLYVCVWVLAFLFVCVCMFACVCVRMCLCAHACLFMALCARVCLYACVYGYVRMHASVFLHAFVGVCVYKDRGLYSQNFNVHEFSGLMLFRSRLLT